MYNTIGYCFIADRHHRIVVTNLSRKDDSFVIAFLTSTRCIKSAIIYSDYKQVEEIYKKRLKLFLTQNFNLKKFNIDKVCLNNFFKIGQDFYEVKKLTGGNARRSI